MANRVPDALMYDKGQESMNRVRDTMIRNQEKALTGKRVNRPSDDPVAAMQVLQMKTLAKRDDTVSSNLEVASGFLNLTDASLGELTDVISRAKELALQMSTTTNSSSDSRIAVAKEAEQLFMRAVQIGNTRFGDRYIFGGYQTDHPPFDKDGNYFGDDGKFQLEMDRGQRITVNVAGISPFFGIEEISKSADVMRGDPKKDAQPSVSGALREPASIVAENRGIDPKDQPEEYGQIQKKTGVNLFHAFGLLWNGLLQGSEDDIHSSIEALDSGFQQVITSRAMIGARQNILKMSVDGLEVSKMNTEELRSKAEDADTLQVYSDLAKNENVLKSTLEINRKLLSPSLMDFLK